MTPAAQGDWVHVYRMVFDHPKTKRLGKKLGMDAAAAAGYLVCLWTWAMGIAPDGDLSRFDAEEIEAACGWGGEDGVFLAAATECRWFDNHAAGLVIHDWHDWAGTMVEKRARERQRSADRRAAAKLEQVAEAATATGPEGDRCTTDGRPCADRWPTAGRESEESEERDLTPSHRVRPRVGPVDNSAEGQERDRSTEQEEQPPPASPVANSGESCDGRPCQVRDFPPIALAPLKRAVLKSLRPERWAQMGKSAESVELLSAYAAAVCGCCQASFAEFERPQRDGLCEKALVAAVEGLAGSNDVEAVMRSRLQRSCLAEHIGDRKLEELRRTRTGRRRKGEPRSIGDCMPPGFAEPRGPSPPLEDERSGAA